MNTQQQPSLKKKILIDVSVLGDAYHNNLSKTGIARVAENLLKHFVQNPEMTICPVTFTGNDSACYQFIKKEIGIDGFDMKFLIGNKAIYRLISLLFRLEAIARNAEFQSQNKFNSNLLQTLKNTIKCLRRRLSQSSSKKEKMLHAEKNLFYLSTASGPPQIIRNLKEIQIGVIVHDTIPITHIEYCKESTTAKWYRTLIDELERSDQIFCVSGNTRKDLLHVCPRLEPNQVHVFHLAAKESFSSFYGKSKLDDIIRIYQIPKNKPIALYVGTVEPRKNLDGLIKAVEMHFQQNPDSDLHIVLSGAIGWKVEKLLKDLESTSKIRERITMTGFVAEEHLPLLYNAADFFIFPSHYEGFGLPVLEAMQCGLPVICSNTSSLPEVGGGAVRYVDPLDTDDMATAITELFNNAELRATLKEKSLQQATQFTWKNTVASILEKIV